MVSPSYRRQVYGWAGISRAVFPIILEIDPPSEGFWGRVARERGYRSRHGPRPGFPTPPPSPLKRPSRHPGNPSNRSPRPSRRPGSLDPRPQGSHMWRDPRLGGRKTRPAPPPASTGLLWPWKDPRGRGFRGPGQGFEGYLAKVCRTRTREISRILRVGAKNPGVLLAGLLGLL